MSQFEQAWASICGGLSSPQRIRNWSVDKGYFGSDFTAWRAGATIECLLSSGTERLVPRSAFAKVYQLDF